MGIADDDIINFNSIKVRLKPLKDCVAEDIE